MDLLKKKWEQTFSFWFFFIWKQRSIKKKYKELCDGVKNEIVTINSSKASEYGNNFMKVKCNLDDGLPLNRLLELHMSAIVFTSVFEEDAKFYP